MHVFSTPASKLKTHAIKHLFLDNTDFTRDDIYRNLSIFPTYENAIIEVINKRIDQLYKRDTSNVYYSENMLTKHDFAIDTRSHHHFMANANRMMQRLLAYNLHNLMCRVCMSDRDRKTHMCTMRTKLIKVAGKLTRSARYQTFKLCSGCPYQRFFVKLFERIFSVPQFNDQLSFFQKYPSNKG